MTAPRIQVETNGPYRVTGVPLVRMRPVRDENGLPVAWERTGVIEHEDVYALCRCGASETKPFCDGSEERVGFDGTEVADRQPTVERRFVTGEDDLRLSDDTSFCAKARFCMRKDTDAWALAEQLATDGDRALLVEIDRKSVV